MARNFNRGDQISTAQIHGCILREKSRSLLRENIHTPEFRFRNPEFHLLIVPESRKHS